MCICLYLYVLHATFVRHGISCATHITSFMTCTPQIQWTKFSFVVYVIFNYTIHTPFHTLCTFDWMLWHIVPLFCLKTNSQTPFWMENSVLTNYICCRVLFYAAKNTYSIECTAKANAINVHFQTKKGCRSRWKCTSFSIRRQNDWWRATDGPQLA